MGTVEFEYDGMYRLLLEYRDLPYDIDPYAFQYTYDPVGNRLSHELLDDELDPDEETEY